MPILKIGKNCCHVTVDMQIDFTTPDGKLYVEGVLGEPTMEEVIANIIEVDKQPFGWRTTTEDEHVEDHIEYKTFGIHCAKGTEGQKYHLDLMDLYMKANENLVKGQDRAVYSYSISTSRHFNLYITRLRETGIDTLVVDGVAFTHCLGHSAIAYANQGFKTFIVINATRSVPPPYGHPEVMKQLLKLSGVALVKLTPQGLELIE